MNSPAIIIALNTFRELVRGKALYGVLFISLLTVVVSAAFGSVSVGDQLLVVKDFGLFSISASSVIFAVITGASLLHKELERKTVFNILSKPVERWHFVVGKFLGMYVTQLVFIALSCLVITIFASFYDGKFDLNLLATSYYVALEALIVCSATLFFSALVVTPALNGLFSLGFFLAGRSVDYLLAFIQEGALEGLAAATLRILYYLLPHLPKLNIANEAVFGTLPALDYTAWATLYALGYASLLLILASILFSRREFN